MKAVLRIAAWGLLIGPTSGLAGSPGFTGSQSANKPTEIVCQFLYEVRSGRNPDAAPHYFADKVNAHQVTAEGVAVVVRTPQDYARHVRDFLASFGDFDFVVEEVIANDNRVFVRWRQTGQHLTSLFGEMPTGAPLTELTSVVYRVDNDCIQEYWLQTDRMGLKLQLERLEQSRNQPKGKAEAVSNPPRAHIQSDACAPILRGASKAP